MTEARRVEASTRQVRPMSDRRFLLVLVGALAAVLGVAMIALGLLELQDPVHLDLETGAVEDTSRLLMGAVILGAVLALGGVSTAVALLRAQLRAP